MVDMQIVSLAADLAEPHVSFEHLITKHLILSTKELELLVDKLAALLWRHRRLMSVIVEGERPKTGVEALCMILMKFPQRH